MVTPDQPTILAAQLGVSEEGVRIPASLCAEAKLGREVQAFVYEHRIELRPARCSADMALARAGRYLLMNVGDQVVADNPRLETSNGVQVWKIPVYSTAQRNVVGLLELDGATGAVIEMRTSGG